jgi:hypothetical protein
MLMYSHQRHRSPLTDSRLSPLQPEAPHSGQNPDGHGQEIRARGGRRRDGCLRCLGSGRFRDQVRFGGRSRCDLGKRISLLRDGLFLTGVVDFGDGRLS